MSMQKILQIGIVIYVWLILANCAGQPVKFDEISNQKYDSSQGKRVSGSSCGFQLLLVFPININSRARIAYDALMRDAGPNYVVTDIKVQEKWYYAAVGTVYCTEFEGTAYPKKVASTNQ